LCKIDGSPRFRSRRYRPRHVTLLLLIPRIASQDFEFDLALVLQCEHEHVSRRDNAVRLLKRARMSEPARANIEALLRDWAADATGRDPIYGYDMVGAPDESDAHGSERDEGRDRAGCSVRAAGSASAARGLGRRVRT
jgi:hypothetical protein